MEITSDNNATQQTLPTVPPADKPKGETIVVEGVTLKYIYSNEKGVAVLFQVKKREEVKETVKKGKKKRKTSESESVVISEAIEDDDEEEVDFDEEGEEEGEDLDEESEGEEEGGADRDAEDYVSDEGEDDMMVLAKQSTEVEEPVSVESVVVPEPMEDESAVVDANSVDPSDKREDTESDVTRENDGVVEETAVVPLVEDPESQETAKKKSKKEKKREKKLKKKEKKERKRVRRQQKKEAKEKELPSVPEDPQNETQQAETLTASTEPTPTDSVPVSEAPATKTRKSKRKAVEKEPDQVIRTSKMVSNKEELSIKGPLCREITSPCMIWKLELIRSSPGSKYYKLHKILGAASMEVYTAVEVKSITSKSLYFEFEGKQKNRKIQKEFDIVLKAQGLTWDHVLSQTDIYHISRSKNTVVASIFNNINQPQCYYDALNTLGSDITRMLSPEDIFSIFGHGAMATDDDKLRIFESICAKSVVSKEIAEAFRPSDSDAANRMETLRHAYEILHSLRETRTKFKSTVYKEDATLPWPEEVFNILKTWTHTIVTGIKCEYSSELECRYIQLVEDAEREKAMASLLAGIEDVRVIDFDVDMDASEGENYFTTLMDQIKSTSADHVITTTNMRRIELLKHKLPLHQNSVKAWEDAFDNSKKSNTISGSRVLATLSVAPVSTTTRITNALSDLVSVIRKRDNVVKTLVIDRAHVIADDELISLIKTRVPNLKHLILAGSSQARTNAYGTLFSDMASNKVLRVCVSKRQQEDLMGLINDRIEGFYATLESAMGALKPGVCAFVFANNSFHKSELAILVERSQKNMYVKVYDILEYSYETAPGDIVIVDLKDFDRSLLIKAIQCCRFKNEKNISFVGTKEQLAEVCGKYNRRKKGNLVQTVLDTVNNAVNPGDAKT